MDLKNYLLLAFLCPALLMQAQEKPLYFIPNTPYITGYANGLYHIKTFEEELKTINTNDKLKYIAVETHRKYFNEKIRDFSQSNIKLDSAYNEIGRFTIRIIKEAKIDKKIYTYKQWQFWDNKAQKLTKNSQAANYKNAQIYQIIGDSIICQTEERNGKAEETWCKYFNEKGILIREEIGNKAKLIYNYAADSLVASGEGAFGRSFIKNTYKFNAAGKPLSIIEAYDDDIQTITDYTYYPDNKLKTATLQQAREVTNVIDYTYNAKGQISIVNNNRTIEQENSGLKNPNTAKIVSHFSYFDNGMLSNIKTVFYYNNGTVAHPLENRDYTYDATLRLIKEIKINWHYKYFDPERGSWQERDIFETTYKEVNN